MPAMIDMEMPKSCRKCPCKNSMTEICMVEVKSIRNASGLLDDSIRPDWCPLHEVKFTDGGEER
jgi:hypothetical protein